MKEINIKHRTYCFFYDMINIKDFNSDLLKLDKMSYKNITIYYIGYVTLKYFKYVSIHRVKPLYFIVDEVHGSTEEKSGNEYLVFASTDKNKEVLKNCTTLWDEIKKLIECNSIRKIDNKPGEFGKNFMKIEFNSDDNLSLNKISKIS